MHPDAKEALFMIATGIVLLFFQYCFISFILWEAAPSKWPVSHQLAFATCGLIVACSRLLNNK